MARLSQQDIRIFRDRIRIAKRMQDDFKKPAERYLNYYIGKHPILLESIQDRVVVNYMMPMVEMKTAAVASTAPIWRFYPRTPAAEVRSLIWGAVMPWVWQEAAIHYQMRAAHKDAKVFGFGVVKVGYRFETDKAMFYDLTEEEYQKRKAQAGDQEMPGSMEILELQGEYVARNPSAVILYDNVFVERIPPTRWFPDPMVDYLNLPRADWIAEQCVWLTEDVKKNPMFSGVRDLKGDKVWDLGMTADLQSAVPPPQQRPEGGGPKQEHSTIWYISDRKRNLIATFAETKDDPLYVQDFPYEYEGYPYEVLPGYVAPSTGIKPNEWRPLGDVEQAIPVQDEKNLLRSRGAVRVRRLIDKYAIADSAVIDGTMDALKSDEEAAVIRLGGNVGPGTVNLLESRGFPNDLRAHEANIDRDFSTITGQPEYSRAVPATGVETATEASILQQMAGVRSQDDQNQWDDFNVRVGRKIKALVEQYYDAPRVAQVSREVAEQIQEAQMMQQEQAMGGPAMPQMQTGHSNAWVTFDRDTIRAEADIQVEAGSSAFRNRILEQQRTATQFAPLWNNPYIRQDELMKIYILRGTDFGREVDRITLSAEQLMQAQAQAAMAGAPGTPPGPGAGGEGQVKAPGGTDQAVTRATAQVAQHG